MVNCGLTFSPFRLADFINECRKPSSQPNKERHVYVLKHELHKYASVTCRLLKTAGILLDIWTDKDRQSIS